MKILVNHFYKSVQNLSRAFLKSSWCKYELRMAFTEESYRKRQVNHDLTLDVLQYYNKKIWNALTVLSWHFIILRCAFVIIWGAFVIL